MLPATPRPTPVSRILIADDDRGVLQAMESLLSESYDVVTARDGEEALARVSQGDFDLVILDLFMPLLDGENALMTLRRNGYRGGIIVMSSRGDRLGRTRTLGADDFLAKPFEYRELERMVERLLPLDNSVSPTGRPRPHSSS